MYNVCSYKQSKGKAATSCRRRIPIYRICPYILLTAAPFYRVLGQSVFKRAEKMGFQKPPLFYGNAAVA